MSRRRMAIITGGVAAAAAGAVIAFLLGTSGTPPPRRLNVVLVSIDTLRANHLGCYGYERETSPKIDALASKGATFKNAIAQASWTLPSHMSLFTGLYPPAHGVETDGSALRAGVMTLPMIFKRAGYRTVGIVSSPYVGRPYGFDRSFDRFRMLPDPIPRNSERLTAEAIKELKQLAKKKQRFFLFLHYLGPHTPYDPPHPFDTMFDPGYKGSVDGKGSTIARYFSPRVNPSERDLRHIIALYDGEIAHIDGYIGELYAELEKLGLARDTVFIVLSDHGEEFSDHGSMDHGRSLYDEVISVPLIMVCPGFIPGGRIMAQQVQLIDLVPTLCDMLGIKRPEGIQGVSFDALVRGRALASLRHGRQEYAYSVLVKDGARPATMKSVRSPSGEKYIVTFEPERKIEAYRVSEDPGERMNLSASAPGLVRRLEEKLEEWSGEAKGEGPRAKEAALTEGEKKVLRSLGYLSEKGSEEPRERPSGGGAAAGLREPRDVAIGPDGTLYVADFGNKCVRRLSAGGEIIGTLGGPGEEPGNFRDPSGIAVGRDGAVYVSDTWNQRIQKLSAGGEFIEEFGTGFFAPEGIALDGEGNIYVADTGNAQVKKLSPEGKLLWASGKKGSAPGEFNAPVDVAVRGDGTILVTDSKNRRLQLLDSEGNYVRSIPVEGWPEGVFNLPYADIDSAGNLYVSDPLGNRVLKMSPAGELVAALGPRADGGALFKWPTGIAVDEKDGVIYVVETGHDRVSRIPLDRFRARTPGKKKRTLLQRLRGRH